MKTIFEFDGNGYLTLTAEGQSVTLSKDSPKAELLLSEGAEVEAVHSEKEPKEKEKFTLAKILLLIVLIPIILIIFLIAFAVAVFGGMDGIEPEKFFKENNPFITKKKFTVYPEEGKSITVSVDDPVYNKKKREYTLLPQIKVNGAEARDEAEYSYLRTFTRFNYKADHYTECALMSILTLALAALGVLFMFHLPPIAENPVFFILCLLASLVLVAFPVLTAWVIIKTEKVLKETEKNILTLTKGKIEK